MSNDELHKAIFDKASGSIAANAGECFIIENGRGSVAKSSGIKKLTGNSFCTILDLKMLNK